MRLAERRECPASAVIGPLVVAGVSIMKKDLPKLKKLEVRDSKELSPKRREALEKKIEKVAKDIVVLKVGPCKIDTYRKQGVNLNRIEAIKFAEVLSFLCPHCAYVDSPDVKPKRLEMVLKKLMGQDGVELIAEHKADSKYPVVSAASIMAKVERDRSIKTLRKKYGDLGPGYSSNPITQAWLKNWLENNKKFPKGVVRETWATTKNAHSENRQSMLKSFFKRIRK